MMRPSPAQPASSASRGFTLLELIIAIAIIAVLGAIAVPVTLSMLANSREAACLGNLRSIGIGLQGYLQDHNDRLPVLELGRSDKSEDIPVLETVLLEYTGSPEVFHCPEDREQFRKTGSSYNWNVTQNGRHMSKVDFFGIENRPESVPLVSDKEAWHPGGTNFLYADFSGSSDVRFSTSSRD